MGRSPSGSAHSQLPGCLAPGQSPIWEGGAGTPGLTLVVLDQLLQRVEVVSWGDVEATAVQSPDLVMLHCPSPQLVPIPHRERVRAWAGRDELAPRTGAHSCCSWPARCSWHAQSHRPAKPTASIPLCFHHPFSARPTMPAPQIPKAASKGHIPCPCRGVLTCGSTTGHCRGTSRESMGPQFLPAPQQIPGAGEGAPLPGKSG